MDDLFPNVEWKHNGIDEPMTEKQADAIAVFLLDAVDRDAEDCH